MCFEASEKRHRENTHRIPLLQLKDTPFPRASEDLRKPIQVLAHLTPSTGSNCWPVLVSVVMWIWAGACEGPRECSMWKQYNLTVEVGHKKAMVSAWLFPPGHLSWEPSFHSWNSQATWRGLALMFWLTASAKLHWSASAASTWHEWKRLQIIPLIVFGLLAVVPNIIEWTQAHPENCER